MAQLITFAQLDDNLSKLAKAVRDLSGNPSAPYDMSDQEDLQNRADALDDVSDNFHSCYSEYGKIAEKHVSTASDMVLSAYHLVIVIKSGVNNTYTESYVDSSIQHASDAVVVCIKDAVASVPATSQAKAN